MKVDLRAEFDIVGDTCKASTGQDFDYWIKYLEDRPELAAKRREAINELYNEMGRGKDVWWSTTAYVAYQAKHNIVKKDGLAEGYTICATKTISADVETLFRAWQHNSETWYGTFSHTPAEWGYFDESGNQNEWTRIRENKDLRFNWQTNGVPHQTQVDITFAENKKGKTLITITHARIQTREETDGLRNAWNEALDKLKSISE